jgi:hypothetical protein
MENVHIKTRQKHRKFNTTTCFDLNGPRVNFAFKNEISDAIKSLTHRHGSKFLQLNYVMLSYFEDVGGERKSLSSGVFIPD